MLWANYFALNPPAKLQIERYSILIDDQEIKQQKRKKQQIVKQVLEEIPGYSQRKYQIATDYADKLISVGTIPDLDKKTFQIRYKEDDEDEPKERAKMYNVTFEQTASYDIDDVVNFLNSTDIRSYPDRQDIIGALNIVLRQYAKSSDSTVVIGAKAYPMNAQSWSLKGGLVALKGFFSSVRFASGRILVNVKTTSGSFYSPILVSEIMNEYGRRDLRRLERFLKGVKVSLTHIPPKKKGGKEYPRIKTIWGFARKADGYNDEHRPRLKRGAGAAVLFPQVADANHVFGAKPAEVEFWISKNPSPAGPSTSGGKGKKGKSSGGGGGDAGAKTEGSYISVFDHFKTSKYLFRTFNMMLTYVRQQDCLASHGSTFTQRWFSGETVIHACGSV